MELWALTLAWHSPGHCSHLQSQPEQDLIFSLFLFLFYSAFQVSEINLTKKLESALAIGFQWHLGEAAEHPNVQFPQGEGERLHPERKQGGLRKILHLKYLLLLGTIKLTR